MQRTHKHNQSTQTHVIRIASYNVHSCLGLDGSTNLVRIAGIINNLDADIVALQEVASQLGVSNDTRQLNALAAETGLQAIAGPALIRPDSPCGTALLHRLPVLGSRHIDLSQPGREPRGALDVDLDLQGLTVRIVSTHLGLRAYERRVQCQQLLSVLAEGKANALTILTGDMNEWWPWSRILHEVNSCFDSTEPSAPATFPARFPVLALDRLWLKSQIARISDLRAKKTATTAVASDHLPLIADIVITHQATSTAHKLVN
ncbi:MAG: endonuclease/exonuclease/phosphatase family protein [Candidatus Competibacteraceae bacterium]|jgi:endonuclease/exonuclease/phosphatase family metal-dependent hydrolase|nr:endonuclease/exonuclease/phosphatase family protein [Candidatus Competibacteraceae bacterium]